jgi:hypothetical protein
MKKELVIDAIKEFPQDFDLDILFEKLIFIEKVEKGLLQLEQDKTIPHNEVKEMIKKWYNPYPSFSKIIKNTKIKSFTRTFIIPFVIFVLNS